MNKDFRQRCKDIIAKTLKETKEQAKADMKDAIHHGRVADGCRKRFGRD